MKRLMAILMAWALSTSVWAFDDPKAMIKATADKVLSEVTLHKDELEKDLSGLYVLVQEAVVPNTDFYRMSQVAMGRYWRRADEEQRQKIAHEFREMLVRTYATALLNYSGEQIEYLPVRSQPGDKEVMVPTRINLQGGGPAVPIHYRVYLAEDGWKLYDVVIDGVSLVANYRSSFASQIRRGGVDGLIQQLAQRNEQLRK